MSKKFGLGKWLNALIPEEVSNNINSKKEKNKDGVALIDINLIKNNNEQPRKLFDDENIKKSLKYKYDSNLNKEMSLGMTIYGPHRDDFLFLIGFNWR